MPPVLVRECDNWKVLKASEADTKCYYFNTKTKEVTWLMPPGLQESGSIRTGETNRSGSVRRHSISSTNSGPQVFGTALPIDKFMLDSKNDNEEPEYETSRSESDRPRQLSIHGPLTVYSPQPPQAPPVEESVIPERPPTIQVISAPPIKPAWKPTVGQPCGALWIDGHFWKATVVAEEESGLRYKVMYDVDGSEALVAREALRPPKVETKAPEPAIRAASATLSRPSLAHELPKSTSASSPWANKDASNARSEMLARQSTLVQQFTAEFPNLRLPSLEDFYRPQYTAALNRFGQQDFELLCDAQKAKGPIGFFKTKGFLK